MKAGSGVFIVVCGRALDLGNCSAILFGCAIGCTDGDDLMTLASTCFMGGGMVFTGDGGVEFAAELRPVLRPEARLPPLLLGVC